MRYLLAIILPPLSVLIEGKPFQAIINFFLCLLFYFPGAVHAILIVMENKKRKELIELGRIIKAKDEL